MATASPWEEMEETFFTCSICFNNFEDPKQLPCLHKFCRKCLKPIIDKHKKSFRCPMCNSTCTKPATGVDGLRSDFHSKNIIQFIQLQKTVTNEEIRACLGCSKDTKVAAHCFKCKGFLCEHCYELHQTNGMLKHHRGNVLTLESITAKNLTFRKLMSFKQPPSCSEHPEKPAEICCGSCGNLPICIVCGHHEKHKGHELHGVKVLAEEERRRAIEIQAKLQTSEETVHQMPQDIEDAKKALQANVATRKEKLQKQRDQKAEEIRAKKGETEEALKKHNEEAAKKEQKEVAELEGKRQQEIQVTNDKYDKLISDARTKNKKTLETTAGHEEKYMAVLSKTSGSVNERFKELDEALDRQCRENLEKLNSLSDDSAYMIQRFDNYMSTVKSILGSCDDWTDVRSLPEINAAGGPLITDSGKGYPELRVLSDVSIEDLAANIPEKMDMGDELPAQDFVNSHSRKRPHSPSPQRPVMPSPFGVTAPSDAPGIECSLCRQKFPISVVEAHASVCNFAISLDDAVGNGVPIREQPKRAPVTVHHSSPQLPDPPESQTSRPDNHRSRPDNTEWKSRETKYKNPRLTKTRAKDTAPNKTTPGTSRPDHTRMDYVDAAILQMVENDEITIVQPRKTRTRSFRTLRPKDDKGEDEGDVYEIEDFEDEEENISSKSSSADRLPNGDSSSEELNLRMLYGGVPGGRRGPGGYSQDDSLEWTQPGSILFDEAGVDDSPIKAYQSIKETNSIVNSKNQFKEVDSVKSMPQGRGRGGRRGRWRGKLRGRGRRKKAY